MQCDSAGRGSKNDHFMKRLNGIQIESYFLSATQLQNSPTPSPQDGTQVLTLIFGKRLLRDRAPPNKLIP